ncbi:MAG: DUF1499 domain-containing protein [Planctomycetota bacterium]
MNWIAVVTLAITGIAIARVILTVEDWQRDWTQNDASLTDDAADERLRPVIVPLPSALAGEAIIQWAERQPLWRLQSDSGALETGSTLALIRTTRWMRFSDDVVVTLESVGDETTRVLATSQSRVGKGDLGQNPRNLRELTSMLRALSDSQHESSE